MSIGPRDLLLFVGGEAMRRYGTFARRTTTIGRGGEDASAVFSRASVGTHHTKDGSVMEAAAGVPRIDWIDTDGDGILDTPTLLMERDAINMCLHSSDVTVSAIPWVAARATKGMTPSGNPALAPDGTLTGYALIEDTSPNTTHILYQVFPGVTANNPYTWDVYLQAGARTWANVQVNAAATSANRFNAWFDLINGVVGTTSAAGTGAFLRARIRPSTRVPGWWRCEVSGNVNDGATDIEGRIELAVADGVTNYTGDGSSQIYIWGAQFEDGAHGATSLIQTTTAPVTREQDGCVVPYRGPIDNITLYTRFQELGTITATGNSPRVLQCGAQGSLPGQVRILQDADGLYRAHAIAAAGAVTTFIPSPSPKFGDIVELMVTVTDGVAQIHQTINGGAPVIGAVSPKAPGPLVTASPEAYLGSNPGGGIDSPSMGLIAGVVARNRPDGTPRSLDEFRRLLN